MSLPASIDALKSTIGKRGGLARANRFALYISHPANGNLAFQSSNLINTNFTGLLTNFISGSSISLGSFFNDPRDMFLLCESTSIPGKRIATMEQVHNHYNEKMPYSAITEEVVMSFILTNDYHTKKYFDSWQEAIVDTSRKHFRPSYKKTFCADITIQQLNASNDIVPGYSVKLINAYPLQVSSVELSNQTDNAIMQVSVTIEYDHWEPVGLIDGFKDLLDMGKDALGDTVDTIKSILPTGGAVKRTTPISEITSVPRTNWN